MKRLLKHAIAAIICLSLYALPLYYSQASTITRYESASRNSAKVIKNNKVIYDKKNNKYLGFFKFADKKNSATKLYAGCDKKRLAALDAQFKKAKAIMEKLRIF